jgi:hypothetical protein
VDYILCNRFHLQVHQHTWQKEDTFTDHDLIYTRLPLHAANTEHSTAAADHNTQPHSTDSTPSRTPEVKQNIVYKWIPGEQLNEYNTSAHKWREHTATKGFTTAFENIENIFANDNEKRAEKIEDFLIAEAVVAGVMTKTIITESKNPNKWEKHMAPWYNEECKEAKKRCKKCRQIYGSTSIIAKEAYKEYKKCCARNRAKL